MVIKDPRASTEGLYQLRHNLLGMTGLETCSRAFLSPLCLLSTFNLAVRSQCLQAIPCLPAQLSFETA